MADMENTPCCTQDGLFSTKVALKVKLEKNHPWGGARERRGISVGAADYDEDNSCAELADRDMEILVVRPGKDVRGLYPGQVGRVHQTYVPKRAPGPFSRLQPAPVNYETQAPFQLDFDNSALRNYVHFQNTVRKLTADWYSQTSYKAAFDFSYLKTGHENKHMPTTVPVPYITWNRHPGQRIFSASQAYT